MTLSKFSSVLLTGSLLLSGFSAKADDAPLQVKDWTLRESGETNNSTCSISTSVRKGLIFKVEVYTLEFVKLKNKPESPVEVLIRIDKNKRGSTGFKISLPTASSEMAFSRLTSGQPETFWGIGKNMSTLIGLLKAKESFDTRGVGGDENVPLNFSSKGFSEVLTEMETRCNGGVALINASFEENFLSAVANSIDPTHLTLETTNSLRSIYFQASSSFLQIKETQTALNLVLANYQPFISELNQVRTTLNQIQNVDLPNNRTRLAAAQKQQVDATAEIARLSALIPGLQTKVQQAQRAFDEAAATLAPLEPEFNRLSQQLNNAQNLLRQSQSRLSSIDDRLDDLTNELNALRSESDSLQRSTSQERYDLSNAQSYLNQAERERANFNVSYERDQRLRNNSEYRRMNDEQNRLIPSAQETQRELRDARRERDRIASQLSSCQATPDPDTQCTTGSFCNPQGETIKWSCGCGSVPGGVSQGGGCYHVPTGQQCGKQPTVPFSNKLIGTLRVDCSSLENALASADRQVSNLETDYDQIQYRLNDLNRRISDIENQVSNEVQREYSTLVDREQDARQRVSNIENTLRRDESRLAQIINSEIPNREREQSSLSSERPRVLSDISQASSAVETSNRQLAAFRASSDWDRKKSLFDSTNRDLRTAQTTLASTLSQKTAAEGSLQTGASDETQLKASIVNLEARVVSLTQRDQELVAAIAPLEAERAPLDAKISALLATVSSLKDQFLNLLR